MLILLHLFFVLRFESRVVLTKQSVAYTKSCYVSPTMLGRTKNIYGGRAMAQVASCRLLTVSHFSLTPGYCIWDLWWTKQHWEKFSPSTSIFTFTYYSTNAPYSFIYRRSHIISVTRITTPPSPPK